MNTRMLLYIVCVLLFLSACSKSSTSDNSPAPPPPTSSSFYFKFTLDGVANNFNYSLSQYPYFYTNEFSGREMANESYFPVVALTFAWAKGDTIQESDVMALAGKTFYFNDTLMHPQIEYDVDANPATPVWKSVDTGDAQYYVKVSSVTYLKDADAEGNPIKIYEVKGTCNALLAKDGVAIAPYKSLTNGAFDFVMSRRDY